MSKQIANTNSDLSTLLAALRKGLADIYGARLRRVLLFGSHARGEAQAESDIDIAVVLEDFDDPLAEIELASELLAEFCLRHGQVVTLLPIREREYLIARFPIHMNLRREGVPI